MTAVLFSPRLIRVSISGDIPWRRVNNFVSLACPDHAYCDTCLIDRKTSLFAGSEPVTFTVCGVLHIYIPHALFSAPSFVIESSAADIDCVARLFSPVMIGWIVLAEVRNFQRPARSRTPFRHSIDRAVRRNLISIPITLSMLYFRMPFASRPSRNCITKWLIPVLHIVNT